ncbi:MAG TPA: Hsp20/alpha crystallin family protein [bacterium]|nr:Hsp20/alpha crystallin family protein [bacterium]
MKLVRWSPVWDVDTLQRSVDRLFDEVFTRPPLPALASAEWEPPVEVYETGGEVVVRAELPNIDPKFLDITVAGDAVTIKGEVKRETEQKDRNYYRRELRYGAFVRMIPLRVEVKGAEAVAQYKDGILEVKIPKATEAKPVSVKVQAA